MNKKYYSQVLSVFIQKNTDNDKNYSDNKKKLYRGLFGIDLKSGSL